MSTVSGAVTLVAMYAWGLALFKDRSLALWAALLTLVNHLLYVQARIAMLDTFMFAFLAWALAAFTAAWDADTTPERQRRYLGFAGWMLGLAAATKWSALFAWAACVALIGLARVVPLRGQQIGGGHGNDRPSRLFGGLSHWDLAYRLIVFPVMAYGLCFVPRIAVEHEGPWYSTIGDFFQMQARMYDRQLRVPGQHAYMSHWYQWPLLHRPIWYTFEATGSQVRGVLLLGNPLVMWSGMAALVICARDWIRHRSREPFLILFFYASLLLPWVRHPAPPVVLLLLLSGGHDAELRAGVRHARSRRRLRSPLAEVGFPGDRRGRVRLLLSRVVGHPHPVRRVREVDVVPHVDLAELPARLRDWSAFVA